jgi:hydrogenase 3 maturation protease
MTGENVFGRILKGKVVIVGVGNVLRGDDGLGPVFVERLKSQVGVPCINAGNAFENYLGVIIRERPETVLLVDAVHLDKDPGEFAIVDPARIEHGGLSTHDVSPSLFLNFLVEEIKCSVFLLGIQPERIALGTGISQTVRETLRILENEVVEGLSSGESSSSDILTSEPNAAFWLQ